MDGHITCPNHFLAYHTCLLGHSRHGEQKADGNEEEEPGRLNSGLRVHFTLLWTVFAWLEQPNNVLSDTDVALSNSAGYCAKTRVTNSPCPPVPLPPQDARECLRKRHG